MVAYYSFRPYNSRNPTCSSKAVYSQDSDKNRRIQLARARNSKTPRRTYHYPNANHRRYTCVSPSDKNQDQINVPSCPRTRPPPTSPDRPQVATASTLLFYRQTATVPMTMPFPCLDPSCSEDEHEAGRSEDEDEDEAGHTRAFITQPSPLSLPPIRASEERAPSESDETEQSEYAESVNSVESASSVKRRRRLAKEVLVTALGIVGEICKVKKKKKKKRNWDEEDG
ncbi:hypothetical protein EDC01DRAFT_745305 [Geopyxis carbonaria]|nr:hypothetical protein EDC01DRAFT_745305 [Geopyxis carbonaria]